MCAEFNQFDTLNIQQHPRKPRSKGITEIRASYYTVLGLRQLEDVLEVAGPYIDSIKFAGGAFTLYPDKVLKKFISICHDHDVLVSTGGFVEKVLTLGTNAVHDYIDTCAHYGFDIIELSAGFISIPEDDWMRLCDSVIKNGLKAKPEIGILFGAGGATPERKQQKSQLKDATYAAKLAKRFIDAGAYMIMIESEGITEDVDAWRTDVPGIFISECGMDKLMFEAADPEVFSWYVMNFGADVNLFVDHSQIIQLECLRRGLWGTNQLWGRVVRFE